MAYQKKTWVNRQSEYPNRRGLRAVAGATDVYDITREEGLVVEEGDPFDQVSMNALEGRVAAAFEEITRGTIKAGRAVTADSAGTCTGNAATATRANTAATADNATKAYGKAESTLSVSYAASAGSCSGNAATATRANTAATADNATKAYGKTESTLSVSYAASAGSCKGNAATATTATTANAVAWGNVSGRPSTFPAAAHNQAAGTITAGTLPVGVLATNSSDYTTSRLRNAYFATSKPSSLTNGMICFVYE